MYSRVLKVLCSVLPSIVLLCGNARAGDSPAALEVHEWGTLTTRHRADGTQEGRLNRIEPAEVLPPFVHTYEPPQTEEDPDRSLRNTPLVPGRPDVTMRLETPVMYFYPGKGLEVDFPIGVHVSFRGGVINEFFPQASASVEVDTARIEGKMRAGIIEEWTGDLLNNFVRSSIAWSIASFPVEATIPETREPVWIAPREVDSRFVEVTEGEAEKYLFYRGVAHLSAVLQTRHSGNEVVLLAPKKMPWLRPATSVIQKIWVAEINAEGELAFEASEGVQLEKDAPSKILHTIPSFARNRFRSENRENLEQSFHAALIKEGLFPKEARAMLETWRHSFFETPGRRIFYIVPQEWIEYHLPVKISAPHRLARAFVGRIDLVDQGLAEPD